jgi:hypothetical protein
MAIKKYGSFPRAVWIILALGKRPYFTKNILPLVTAYILNILYIERMRLRGTPGTRTMDRFQYCRSLITRGA